jgi:hypothetical protein
MLCYIRSLLPSITLCAALCVSVPTYALDVPAPCLNATRVADGRAGCSDARISSAQNTRQNCLLAELLDQTSESGFGLAFAAIMIGALALRVGLR